MHSWGARIARRIAALVASKGNIWRVIMAVFAVAWLHVAIAWGVGSAFVASIALLSAAGNACASWFGFERYRLLVIPLAIVSSALDLLLAGLFVAFWALAYMLSTGDWSGLGGVH